MTLMEDLSQLSRFVREAPSLTVLVGSELDQPNQETSDLVIQRLRTTRTVASEFRRIVIAGTPTTADEVVLEPYDAGYHPDPHELCQFPLAEVPEVEAIVRAVSDVDSAELFHERSTIIDGLRFYAVVLQSPKTGPATFFRNFGPARELSRSAKFGIIFRNGFYDKLEQRVFLLDDNVDCFAWRGHMFIKSVSQFHRIFGYFESLVEKAEATFAAISPRIPISNFDEFREACLANILMLAKLSQIARKPYLNTVTMEDIKRTISEFDLEVPTKTIDGVEKLVFERSPQKRWTILKLLDDDYLGSVMTKLKYVANSKIAVH